MHDDVGVPLPSPSYGEPDGSPQTPPGGGSGDAGYTGGGPVSEETVAALREELRMRADAEGHLRGRLADAVAELEARASVQARLESAHAELRHEFGLLRGLVEQEDSRRSKIESRAITLAAQIVRLEEEAVGSQEQLSRLRGELAASEVSREAAQSEAAGLRSELARLGAELASAREQVGSAEGGLGEAEALLAEARALRARILEQHEPAAQEADTE